MDTVHNYPEGISHALQTVVVFILRFVKLTWHTPHLLKSGQYWGWYRPDLRDPTCTGDYQIENTIVVDQIVGIYVQRGSANLEATFWGVNNLAKVANTGGSGRLFIFLTKNFYII